MVDVVVVGKGPAGWSCAMTARMRGLSVAVVAPDNAAGWLERAERIDNYPGMPQISGRELLDCFARQAADLGVESRTGLVRQILPNDKTFLLLVENDVMECKAVVLAMGSARPALLDGEEAFIGQGVSYCATCDGMLYRGKRLAALLTSAEDLKEAAFLSTLAASVDCYPIKKPLPEALNDSMRQVREKPVAIRREEAGLILQTEKNARPYDGIFIFRAAMPLHLLLSEIKIENSFIAVDRSMRTNMPGVFAAGDCTGKPLQIAKSVGEGNVAAITAAEYINAVG
ncbi:MAG: NAD(P)/FAD-dependent oxidoreductase [Clostridia bacterium]|nr:NAD(P)/FAD-dependent oxidoreductase [Clostridia bacterium]